MYSSVLQYIEVSVITYIDDLSTFLCVQCPPPPSSPYPAPRSPNADAINQLILLRAKVPLLETLSPEMQVINIQM